MKNIRTQVLKKVIFFLLMMCTFDSVGQYFPSTNDTLNYSSVLIQFPWVEGAQQYEVLIQNETKKTGDIVQIIEANKTVINSLEFGCDYSWKVRGLTSLGEKLTWSSVQKFSVGWSDLIDIEKNRYLGKKMSRDLATRGLLFFDYGRVGVNRAGVPSWYFPEMDSLTSETIIRDLKMTDLGTFTALVGNSAIEFDRDGNKIWEAPNDGQVNGEVQENYHHEFTKLPSGNYLVLGLDHVMRKVPNGLDSVLVEFGTVIEYSPKGEVVWSWNSNDYFIDADLFSRTRANGFDVRTHMNAASTDGEHVFVGFRDISRIVVIDKKKRKVVESYGGYGVFQEPHAATGFFRRQHAAVQLEDGNMAVFNNDSIMDPKVVSSVVIFSRIKDGAEESMKLFDFAMDFDTLTEGKSAKTGNLLELENGNLLVNMGDLNRAIELTRDGEVVWSMFMEKYDTLRNTWRAFPQYRVSHANTLYPYEFTAKVESNTYSRRKRSIVIRVFNIGDKPDMYSISLEKKNKSMDVGEITILPGFYEDFRVQLKGKSELTAVVKSINSSRNEEVIVYGFH